MSAVAMETPVAPTESTYPPSSPALHPDDSTQAAVDRALESAQALLRELRSARFSALARHARRPEA